MPALLEDTRENRRVCEDLVARGVLLRDDAEDGFKTEGNPVQVITTSLIPHYVDSDAFVRDQGGVHVHEAGLTDAQIAALFTRHGQDENGTHVDFAHNHQRRYIREIRRTHNLRTNAGRDQIQRVATLNDANATGLKGLAVVNATTTIAGTTLTDTAAAFPTGAATSGNTGLQGHLLYVFPQAGAGTPAMGVIANNTATTIGVDMWYALPITLVAGIPNSATPTSPCNYAITPNVGGCNWVGLSTRTTTAATDVLRSADSLYGDGTSSGAVTEQTTNGLSRQFVFPVWSAAATATLTNTWTYTGNTLVSIGVVVLCNSGKGGAAASGGGLAYLATAVSTANVQNNGDTASINPWTINF